MTSRRTDDGTYPEVEEEQAKLQERAQASDEWSTTGAKALESHLNAVHEAAFGASAERNDANDVSRFMQMMLVNKLVGDAFRAGWVAAGKSLSAGEKP